MTKIDVNALPESVKGLVKNTKTELLNIIARKDANEISTRNHVESLKNKIGVLEKEKISLDAAKCEAMIAKKKLEEKFDIKIAQLNEAEECLKKANAENEVNKREIKNLNASIVSKNKSIDKLMEENEKLSEELTDAKHDYATSVEELQNKLKYVQEELDAKKAEVEKLASSQIKVSTVIWWVLGAILGCAIICALCH